jgi:hypothetical protein
MARVRGLPGTCSPAILNIETLNAIGASLCAYADTIAKTLPGIARDTRLAARAIDKLASLRFRVGEIADMVLTQDGGATARDLRDALNDAEF